MSARQGRVESATRSQLRQLRLTQTPLGAAAVALARDVDTAESAPARATASRELRMLLREVVPAMAEPVRRRGSRGDDGDDEKPTGNVTRLDRIRGRRAAGGTS